MKLTKPLSLAAALTLALSMSACSGAEPAPAPKASETASASPSESASANATPTETASQQPNTATPPGEPIVGKDCVALGINVACTFTNPKAEVVQMTFQTTAKTKDGAAATDAGQKMRTVLVPGGATFDWVNKREYDSAVVGDSKNLGELSVTAYLQAATDTIPEMPIEVGPLTEFNGGGANKVPKALITTQKVDMEGYGAVSITCRNSAGLAAVASASERFKFSSGKPSEVTFSIDQGKEGQEEPTCQHWTFYEPKSAK